MVLSCLILTWHLIFGYSWYVLLPKIKSLEYDTYLVFLCKICVWYLDTLPYIGLRGDCNRSALNGRRSYNGSCVKQIPFVNYSCVWKSGQNQNYYVSLQTKSESFISGGDSLF